jgi:hypothetical protein
LLPDRGAGRAPRRRGRGRPRGREPGHCGGAELVRQQAGGIDSALLGLGKASIGDLTSDDIVVPPGFTRTLGGDGPVFDPALDEQAVTG